MMNNYNPYYPNNNMYNQPHPNYFTNAMLQPYNNQTQQTTSQQQNITTQPPILQPQGNKMIQVSNKEEATGASVDLIYGTPSFFYNKSNGEIYLKQFDVANGNAIFKVYGEISQPMEEPQQQHTHNYQDEFNHINEGIASLHRMLAQLQQEREYPISIKELNTENIEIEEKKSKKKGQ